MKNQLSARFIECLELLKSAKKVPSVRQFSKTIGVHPQCISDIMTGKREVNTDIIQKSMLHFSINPSYVFSGSGLKFLDEEEVEIIPESEVVMTVVTDNEGEERIVHIPYAAQAGYIDQLNDPVFLKDLPSFSLPDSRFKTGSYRCFDVSGDSMEPTLFASDQLICEFIEPNYWKSLRSNYVYVVITDTGIVVKRVVNTIEDDECILLKSDNNFYDPLKIHLDNVKEIWRVTHKLSAFMGSPSNVRNGLFQDIDNLRQTISDQSQTIQSLNKTIEKLLKQNRKESLARY